MTIYDAGKSADTGRLVLTGFGVNIRWPIVIKHGNPKQDFSFGTTDIISSMKEISVTEALASFHLFKATRWEMEQCGMHSFTGCTVVSPGTTALFASTLHD